MSEASNSAGDAEQVNGLARLLITTLIAILLGAGEEIFDPFGLDSQSDRLSANIFNAITSPFYGKAWTETLDIASGDRTEAKEATEFASRFGQSNIRVILIDDSYLEATNKQWPLNPRDYRRILRKLVDAGSAAVFVDIYFRQDNEQRRAQISSLFRDSTCLAAESACSTVDENWSCGAGDGVQPCKNPSSAGGTKIIFAGTLQDPVPSIAGQQPPDTALAAMFSDQNIYQLQDTAINGVTYDTAAWALYKAWCKRSPDCDAATLGDFPTNSMYLHWGYAPGSVMTDIEDFGGSACRPQAASLPGRFLQSLRIFGWNLVRGFNDARIAPCPYHTQIKLQLFNNLSQAELKQLFGGKVVLLGASLQNFPDYQWSPIHDYIPGVFWHAMATDNLMEFGQRYRKDPDEFASNNFEALGIAFILSLHAFITWIIQRKSWVSDTSQLTDAEREQQEWSEIKLDLMHGLLTISVIAAVVLWFTGLRNWSPANWIGFAMLMLLIDYKPVSSLGKFCWRIYPTARLSSRMFSFWVFKVLAGFTVLLAMIPAFLLFIAPHALLLGRIVDDVTGSYLFMAIYVVIIATCFTVIVRETSS